MHIDESLTAKGFTPAASVPAVYGGPRTLEWITIHHWGVPGQTHDGVNNFFVNGPGLTSAHFVASAGRVNCLVSMADAAWHAGNGEGNRTSVGIECRPEATDEDYKTVADLIRWIRETVGKDLPLRPHRSWQATACPGVWDLERLDALARGKAHTTPAMAPVAAQSAPVASPAPTAGLGDNQCRVDPGDTLSGIARQFGVDLNALIAVNGITEPGKIFPGMILDLPSSECIVEAGDTLSGIAAQFGVSLARIIAVNPGINPDRIFPGQVLNL